MGNSVYITFLLIIVHSLQILCHEDVEQDDLTSCLAHQIAEKYLLVGTQNTCITLVADQEALLKFSPFNSSLVRILSNSTNDSCDPSMTEHLATSFHEKCARYIVEITRPDCFLPAWFEAKGLSVFERHNPKIIFLPSNHNENASYGDALLSANETDISADILVIEKSGEEEWPLKIYTNNFYQLIDEPGRSPKIYLDDWHPLKGFRYGTNLFPDKMKDLQQRTLRLFTVPYVPYAHDDPLDGSEVRLIKEFCNVLNCKVEGVYDGMLWGEIYAENQTGVGQVGALYNRNADVGVGANTVWLEFWPYVDFSDCYLGGAVVVIAPKPKVLGGWFTPFLPFPLDLWLVVVGVVIASAIGLYLLTILTMKISPKLAKKHGNNATFLTLTDALLRAMGMLVSQQPASLVTGSPVRHLFTSMEVIYLVITTCYCAQLYDFLTVPRTTKPIDTLEDIVENTLTWLGPDDIWIYLLSHTDEPLLNKFVDLFEAYPPETIVQLSEEGGYGVVVERMTGGHYVQTPYITEKFISKSRVTTGPDLYGMTPITLFLQKGSPYTERLNRFLGHMQNGGLYYPWEADSARRFLNYTLQESLALSAKKETYPPKVLRLSDLEGAFLIYIIGLAIAIIVFFLELYFGKQKVY